MFFHTIQNTGLNVTFYFYNNVDVIDSWVAKLLPATKFYLSKIYPYRTCIYFWLFSIFWYFVATTSIFQIYAVFNIVCNIFMGRRNVLHLWVSMYLKIVYRIVIIELFYFNINIIEWKIIWWPFYDSSQKRFKLYIGKIKYVSWTMQKISRKV